MNIVIIGAGKIGATLTEQLLREGHEITVVDTRTAALDAIGNTLDVMTVEGNGISMDTQVEAGVPSADLVIAVMSTDEQNLLSCLIAKRLGVGNTIARVRNPEYTSGLHLIQDDLGLSMALNPELASATEIARILRAPASIKIDTFSKGRVELHKMRIDAGSILDGMKLSDLGRLQSGALVCVVERGQHEVYIPDGSFTLLAGDRISVVASPKLAAKFFHKIGVQTNPVKRVMLLGGGRISYYLARQMLDFGASVKIIESSAAVCDSLAERLPEATIIHGDGTSEQLLAEEGIAKMDAVASLTGIDEENVLMSLYARSVSSAKIVTKINRHSPTSSRAWTSEACSIPAISRPTTSSATSAPCRTRSARTSRRSIRSSATRPRHWSSAPRRNPPSAAGRSWSCPRGRTCLSEPSTARAGSSPPAAATPSSRATPSSS